MKPAILLLAAAATIGAAPARHSVPAPRYEGGGFEPSWTVVIEHGRLTYDPGYGGEGRISVPLPRRQAVRNGYRYVIRGLTVDVRHVHCESYNGRTYADTIHVTGHAEEGCGGTPIPPPDLGYSGWTIQYVDSTRLPEGGPELSVSFREGSLHYSGQCHVVEGTYRERRPFLHVRVVSESWSDCPRTAIERRIVEIMRSPMRMSFVDGDTLVLTNRAGTLRLTP
jgi:hypothetical protein